MFVLLIALNTDPEFVAREFAGSGLEVVYQRQLLPFLMTKWGDVERALAWTKDTLVGSARSEAIGILIGRMARQSPSKAVAIVEKMPPGSERESAFGALMTSYGGGFQVGAELHARLEGSP